MKRIAAHRICFSPEAIYNTSYVELSPDGELLGVYPLIEEIAGTVFVNGIVLMAPVTSAASAGEVTAQIKKAIADASELPLPALLEKTGMRGAPRLGEKYCLIFAEEFVKFL